MKFEKEQILTPIPYPQLDDPTNCVIYSLMNLFNDSNSFNEFLKEKGGHDFQEETAIMNNCKHLWTDDENHHLFSHNIASNGGHLYDGLTLGQLQGALDYWDYTYECDTWFSAIGVTVASKKKLYGRHQITVYYDGNGGGNKAKLILCDPQIENFIQLKGIHELIAYYKNVMELSIVSYADDCGIRTLYFKKEKFTHIPFEALKE